MTDFVKQVYFVNFDAKIGNEDKFWVAHKHSFILSRILRNVI